MQAALDMRIQPRRRIWIRIAGISMKSTSRSMGKLQYLWRAVDQDGEVLDILVQSRRNRRAAKKFFRKLLRRLQYVPRAIITDRLGSYAAAKAEVLPMCGTSKTSERTIGQRNPISQRESENGACEVSSRLGTPSGFSPPSGSSSRSFVQVAICSQPGTTGKSCAATSPNGAK